MDKATQEALAKLDGWGELLTAAPNYNDEGEMLRMLERWKEAAPENQIREVEILLSGAVPSEIVITLYCSSDGYAGGPLAEHSASAPTFIEAATEALLKTKEKI